MGAVAPGEVKQNGPLDYSVRVRGTRAAVPADWRRLTGTDCLWRYRSARVPLLNTNETPVWKTLMPQNDALRGVIGVFTATIASLFFEQEKESELVAVTARLNAIEEKLNRLVSRERT